MCHSAGPATAWCTASSSESAPKPRSSSGTTAWAASAGPAPSSSPIRKGFALELIVDDSSDPPLVARDPEIPEEHAIRGFCRRPGLRVAGPRARRSCSRRWRSPPSRPAGRRKASARGGSLHSGHSARSFPGLHEERGNGAPRRVVVAPRRARSVAAARSSRPASRPRLSWTASTSSRFTFANRAACCSRSRRSAPGLHRRRTARDPRRVALAAVELRRHLRDRLAGVLTPLPVPRAVLARSGSGVD